MLAIDNYAYTSSLAAKSPHQKVLFGGMPLMICLAVNSLAASALTLLVMSTAAVAYTNITWGRYLRLLVLPTGFMLAGSITVIFQAFPAGQPVLWGITMADSVYGVDAGSLLYGIKLALRALAAVSCMCFISLTTPLNDIIYVLRKWRVPTLVISLMVLIYRYIFVLLDEAQRLQIAQSSRLGYINARTALKSLRRLAASLFVRTFLRCNNVYAALAARGYQGEFPYLAKTYERDNKLIIATLLLCAGLVGAVILEGKIC